MKPQLKYLVFFLSLSCWGQNSNRELDSLLHVTGITPSLSEKASAHSRLAWLYINQDIKTAEAHLDSATVLYTQLKDNKGISVCNYKYAVLNRFLGNYNLALDYIDEYQQYATEQLDTFKIANGLFQKGVIHSLQNNYEASLKAYHKTLSLYETIGDSTGMGFTLNSIGIVYKNLEKYEQAIESYQQAVAIHEKKNDLNNLANVYNGLGTVYVEQQNLDKALDYFNKTLAMDKELKNTWGTAKVSKNIALIYIEKKQYQKALSFLESAYNIQKSHDYTSDLAETLSQLSTVNMLMGNFQKSEALLQQSFKHHVPSKKVFRDMHLQSYKLYDTTGRVTNALHHYKKYTTYKDSILNDENLKQINTLEIQFETEKKDRAIIEQQLLLRQNENAFQKKKVQFNYMTGIAIFLLIVSILIFLVFKQRQKRKTQEILTLKREHQIKTLEALIEGEENERFRIARELHDGVNGDLSAIKYKLSSLLEMNNKVIKEAIAMIDDSCKQVRAISHNLVPPSLKNFNLVEVTETYCNKLNSINPSVEIVFQHLGEDITISKKAEINSFRIIQELVTNSLKHADASKITVQISNRNNSVQITVEDDGKGFDKDEATVNGIGLSNVQSRIDYLNAEVDFISNESGTSYTLDIDITQHNDD
ncbi:sensor histidine kinase [Algibacter sp. 2305UL17-15]|uniref:ATP-binding protein n=1 Tax=Algibacter sp. 2305UL17-15 TaxID=3231268 RepID=UPI00345B32D1